VQFNNKQFLKLYTPFRNKKLQQKVLVVCCVNVFISVID